MLQLFGNVALICALVFSLLQSVVPLLGYWRCNPYLLGTARVGAWGQCVFIVIAYVLLTIAFGIDDFSIAYVAANSHPTLPLMYRLTAVWGAHEGSILLWILILNLWTLFASFAQKNAVLQALVLAVLGIISFFFLCFLLFTSNPFMLTTLPQTGNDLNPLLQDPGFIIHPPMLYAGYVGFSVAFALTQAALIRGTLDRAWANLTRRFAIAAWSFQTLGITLGSWWAYRVLGWGGFWFWDPVENASLLPWLSGTALIHVLILVEKRDIAQGLAAILAIICFALSLLGTFLVRSGVLISAHTFANDPARGVFLLLLLAIVIIAAMAIYMARLPTFSSHLKSPLSWLSTEAGLLVNSGLLSVAMATILLGTLYPLVLDALHLGTISVGAPYFNTVMTPIVFITMFAMGFWPLCRAYPQSATRLLRQAGKNILFSLVIAIALLWGVTRHMDVTALLTVSLSIWIIQSMIGAMRVLPGMSLAHLGIAILVIGIMLSCTLSEERDVRMQPGNVTQIGPYQFVFLNTQGIQGANYRGIRATFNVIKNKRYITTLYPEKRIYPVREMVMTKVDIHPGIFRDLYVALGEPLDDHYWSLRLYYKPFIRWIWFGGIMIMMGGIVALLKREA